MARINRRAVYDKMDGRCGYCGRFIRYEEMQVDHMTSKRNGGTDDMDNLLPVCRLCNHYKRGANVEGFRERMKGVPDRLRATYLFRVAEEFGLARAYEWGGVFYFEERHGRKKK